MVGGESTRKKMTRLSAGRHIGCLLLVIAALSLALLSSRVSAVDHNKFRTCTQTHFCKKYRQGHTSAYKVDVTTVHQQSDVVLFDVKDEISGTSLQGSVRFVLDESISELPVVRMRVDEKLTDPQDPKKRWESTDVLMKEAFVTRPIRRVSAAESGLNVVDDDTLLYASGATDLEVVVVIHTAPFGVDLYLHGEKVISTNGDQQFHYEPRRDRVMAVERKEEEVLTEEPDIHEGKTIVDYGEDGLAIYSDGTVQKRADSPAATESAIPIDAEKEGWEESFGGHTDKKKFGPSSMGFDITFHGKESAPRGLYGIPEHASDFLLKDTLEVLDTEGNKKVLSDPYRLYNLDVFEYELDQTMALYGSIPVMVAPNAHNTVGMFWNNPSETFIDIETVTTAPGTKKTHWMSESGVFDLFLFVGPTSADFFSQYTALTGRASLPPLFAIGYHQCRWNYKNEADVERVDAGFDEHLIPYDVIWLDIDHTIGKRYFTWDEYAFPTPVIMQEKLARVGRKMVTIVDPHIKVPKDNEPPYYIHKEAQELGLFVKDSQGKDFVGWCWPGSSSYVDFTNPKARSWWSSQFRYENYQHSTEHLYTWNDMNEPSVFNGPEVSMDKNYLSIDGVEHREWHNLYGMYMQQATMEGQLVRQLPAGTVAPIEISSDLHRPFVLSRAFFAGSQRFGAIWNGDNTAKWGHLKYTTKMLLSMSVAGLTFVGADVGGFFGDPTPELLTRWYQSAIYQPFFRGHAHHDSKRREPWVFGEPHTSRIRESIRQRYSLLPYLYTLFYDCSSHGLPVMRPLWLHFPQDATSFTEEDQFLLGHDLLVKPIVEENVASTSVFLPSKDTVWYHISDNYKRFTGGATYDNIPAPIEFTPVFQRGGSILTRKNRVRRSSSLMQNDPLTLVVALDSSFQAAGKLYLDDEATFAAQVEGTYSEVQFTVSKEGVKAETKRLKFISSMWVEKIEIYGFQSAANVPKEILVNGERALEFTYNTAKDCLVVRKPNVLVTDNWELRFA